MVGPTAVATDNAGATPAAESKPRAATAPAAATEPSAKSAVQPGPPVAPQGAVETEAQGAAVTPPAREAALRTGAPEEQTAALPPSAAASVVTRILFPEGSFELSEAAKDQLARVVSLLLQDDAARIQLLAFAQGAGGGARRARRLSLTRALVVRGFLIDQGVLSDRVSLRSFGSKIQDGPPDRVDVLLQDVD